MSTTSCSGATCTGGSSVNILARIQRSRTARWLRDLESYVRRLRPLHGHDLLLVERVPRPARTSFIQHHTDPSGWHALASELPPVPGEHVRDPILIPPVSVSGVFDRDPASRLRIPVSIDADARDATTRVEPELDTRDLLLVVEFEIDRVTRPDPLLAREERHGSGHQLQGEPALFVAEGWHTRTRNRSHRTVAKVLCTDLGACRRLSPFVGDHAADLRLPEPLRHEHLGGH